MPCSLLYPQWARPILIGLTEQGKIPFCLIGRHRRMQFDELVSYQREDAEARGRVADELTTDAQEPGMGY